jgi:hypothetical protein
MSKLHISSRGGQPQQHEESKVKSMIDLGQLSPDDLYWKEGMQDWQPLRKLFPPSPYATPSTDPIPVPPEPDGSSYSFAKNPRGLNTFLKVMLWLSLGTTLLTLLSDIGQWMLLNGATIDPGEAEANDVRQGIIALVYFVVFIVTTVAFAKWIHRANLNSRGFGAKDMRFTPGWAVGYYFIPILNLVRPYQAMKEIWKISGNPRDWQNEKDSPILPIWWTLWILSAIVGQVAFRISMRAETLDEMKTSTIFGILTSLVDAPLILVALLLTSRISKRQLRLTETPA